VKRFFRMIAKLQPSSYDRAFWVHSPSAVPQLLQLKDGTERAVHLQAGLATGVQPRQRHWSLAGFPLFCSKKLPALGTKGDLILIDPRYYLIGDRSLTIAASEHVNFLKNQIVFRVTRRGDGPGSKSRSRCKTAPQPSAPSWCWYESPP
jgi:HK97 family phage major capsid protein